VGALKATLASLLEASQDPHPLTTTINEKDAAVTHPASADPERFKTFRDFYPFYLGEHRDAACRRLHVIGSALVLIALTTAIATGNPWLLLLMPVIGYGFAWIGHFAFEKNRPATFTYPLWSLMGDWVMFAEVVTGRRPF
jgi:hypothetical protein